MEPRTRNILSHGARAAGVASVCLMGAVWVTDCAPRRSAAPARRTAVRPPGFEGYGAIAAGARHTCGLSIGGDVYCWGNNEQGQLGLGHRETVGRPFRVPSTVKFTRIAAGAGSTCAIDRRGDLWCWGGLAATTAAQRRLPRRVNGLTEVEDVAVGGTSICAIKRDRSLWCWGSNEWGQLCDGTLNKRQGPVQVKGIGKVRQVSVGSEHACAVSFQGQVYCWGRDDRYQVGVFSADCRDAYQGRDMHLPCSVTKPHLKNLEPTRAVSMGSRHSCALQTDGRVRCWGNVALMGKGIDPLPVPHLEAITSMSLGDDFSCFVGRDGRAWCMGNNNRGQLGVVTPKPQRYEVRPLSLVGVRQLAAGDEHACALVRGGAVKCWGYRPTGALGDGALRALRPLPVRGLQRVVEIVAPSGYRSGWVCARQEDGQVRCWGRNQVAQLGIGDKVHRGKPVKVGRLPRARGLAGGDGRSCAIGPQGRIWCWGEKVPEHLAVVSSERLYGDNPQTAAKPGTLHADDVEATDVEKHTVAWRVPGVEGITRLWMGPPSYTCARKGDGSIWCWRWMNTFVATPDDEEKPAHLKWPALSKWNLPRARDWLKGATDLVLGPHRIYVQGVGGARWRSAPLALIDGKGKHRLTQAGSDAVQLGFGRGFRCELRPDRRVVCQGRNDFGQLGLGQRSPGGTRAVPAPAPPVTGLSAVRSLVVGQDHACAVDGIHRLWCWGRNDNGQLGCGNRRHRAAPTRVVGLPAVAMAAAGNNFTCAVDRAGKVWCWGRNDIGQLGNNVSIVQHAPVKVASP
ncbi:MAG: hypothetical protein ABI333_24570 [bacterium]